MSNDERKGWWVIGMAFFSVGCGAVSAGVAPLGIAAVVFGLAIGAVPIVSWLASIA